MACVRLVLAFAALKVVNLRMRMLAIYDVSVAFYHALLDEDIWVGPPKSENEQPGIVWQRQRALYGTRRAAFLFQQYAIDSLAAMGFARVEVAAQFFVHVARSLLVVVHGDDFMAAGSCEKLGWFDDGLSQFFLLKIVARVGPAVLGGVTEGRFTKRRVSWSEAGFAWEADEKHVKTVCGYQGHGERPAPARLIGPGSKHVGRSSRSSANVLEEADA